MRNGQDMCAAAKVCQISPEMFFHKENFQSTNPSGKGKQQQWAVNISTSSPSPVFFSCAFHLAPIRLTFYVDEKSWFFVFSLFLSPIRRRRSRCVLAAMLCCSFPCHRTQNISSRKERNGEKKNDLITCSLVPSSFSVSSSESAPFQTSRDSLMMKLNFLCEPTWKIHTSLFAKCGKSQRGELMLGQILKINTNFLLALTSSKLSIVHETIVQFNIKRRSLDLKTGSKHMSQSEKLSTIFQLTALHGAPDWRWAVSLRLDIVLTPALGTEKKDEDSEHSDEHSQVDELLSVLLKQIFPFILNVLPFSAVAFCSYFIVSLFNVAKTVVWARSFSMSYILLRPSLYSDIKQHKF